MNAEVSVQVICLRLKVVTSYCVDNWNAAVREPSFEVDRWTGVRQIRNGKVRVLYFRDDSVVDVVVVFDPINSDGLDVHRLQCSVYGRVHGVGVRVVEGHRYKATQWRLWSESHSDII